MLMTNSRSHTRENAHLKAEQPTHVKAAQCGCDGRQEAAFRPPYAVGRPRYVEKAQFLQNSMCSCA